MAKAAGAKCAVTVDRPRLSDAPSDAPPVSTIAVPEYTTFVPLRASTTPPNEIILANDSAVGFLPDTAKFVDPEAARGALTEVAEWLKHDETRRARITGTTARIGSPESQFSLSMRRAEAVAELLTELGATADQLTVIGAGSQFPAYVDDVDLGGNLLPGAAAANRSVRIQLEQR